MQTTYGAIHGGITRVEWSGVEFGNRSKDE